jgi:sulfur-oxidizing protein SoxX
MVCQHYSRCLCLNAPGRVPWRRWSTRIGVCLSVLTLGVLCSPTVAAERQTAYQIVDGTIATPLTEQPGDPERGRQVVLDRNAGDCIVCHAMPLPHRQFHGTIGPALDGVGSRSTAGALRLRLVDPKSLNPHSIMPAYYKTAGLYRVLSQYHNQPILSAQQIEDVVAYLLTLQ